MLHYMFSKYSLLALFAKSKYLIKSCVFPSISGLSICPALILCESCVFLVIIIIIILILILGDDRVIQRGTGWTMWRLCMKKEENKKTCQRRKNSFGQRAHTMRKEWTIYFFFFIIHLQVSTGMTKKNATRENSRTGCWMPKCRTSDASAKRKEGSRCVEGHDCLH